MSSDKRYVLSAVGPGAGWVLDLGGGRGELATALRALGYRYANADLRPAGAGAIAGDAEQLPLRSASCSLVVSCDSLEHFPHPPAALAEARRVLSDDGALVVWVPFLHPFHGDDFFRFTPLGLRMLLEDAGFELRSIEAPLGIASLLGQALVVAFRRIGLHALERPIERASAWADRHLHLSGGQGFAASYLVRAVPAIRSSGAA
jgi:SAM-dependent methyltransferase